MSLLLGDVVSKKLDSSSHVRSSTSNDWEQFLLGWCSPVAFWKVHLGVHGWLWWWGSCGSGSGPQGFGEGHKDKRVIPAGKCYQRIHGDPRPCFLMRQRGKELVLVSNSLIQKTENVLRLFSYYWSNNCVSKALYFLLCTFSSSSGWGYWGSESHLAKPSPLCAELGLSSRSNSRLSAFSQYPGVPVTVVDSSCHMDCLLLVDCPCSFTRWGHLRKCLLLAGGRMWVEEDRQEVSVGEATVESTILYLAALGVRQCFSWTRFGSPR